MTSAHGQPAQGGPPGERPGCIAMTLLALATVFGILTWRRAPRVEGGPDPASLAAGHELSDLGPRQAIVALALLAAAIVALVILSGIVEALVAGGPASLQPIVASAPNVQPPPAPRLETANGQVLEELHARENALLNSYQWIDQKNGVVRIPIERAIELIAQRGLPVRAQPANPPTGVAGGRLTRPESSSSGRTQEATIP